MYKPTSKKSENWSKTYESRRVSNSNNFAFALEDTLNNDLKTLCIQLVNTEFYIPQEPAKFRKKTLSQNFLWHTKNSTSYIEVSGNPEKGGQYEKIVEIQTMPFQNTPRNLINLLKEKGFKKIRIED